LGKSKVFIVHRQKIWGAVMEIVWEKLSEDLPYQRATPLKSITAKLTGPTNNKKSEAIFSQPR